MGNKTFQVLVVEDKFADARFVLDALKETIFDAVWVRRISEAVEHLSSGDHQTHDKTNRIHRKLDGIEDGGHGL